MINESNNLKVTIKYTLLLGVAVTLIYMKLFSANFISWDDGEVLVNNTDVHQFNIYAFFTNYYVGNYAPFSMIAFAIEWLIFKGNPTAHHVMNLLLHMINSVLVYKLVLLLFKDKTKAFLCAIIFCIHPLQVETVAWVSAKNNLLYSMFFLLGLINYSRFILGKTTKQYVYSVLFFIVSVLCKPSAICFPLILVLVDYLLKQTQSIKTLILNKIPFITIALLFGFVTIYTRTEDKFINQNHAYAIYEQIGYAGYAILQYVYKFLVPINLSVIYPYPQNKLMSIVLGYIVILILVVLIYNLFKSSVKTIVFGIMFLVFNLILVLQFIPFGEVLTADRYMYLPIIGISAVVLSIVPLNSNYLKVVITSLFVIYGTLTFIRVDIWKNSISLYTDILKKYPHSYVALNSLGAEYMLAKNYDMSVRYLNAAINENRNYYKGYYNRGLLYAQNNQITKAINDFDKAIELKQYQKAYIARANAYYTLRDFPKAISDAEYILKNDSSNFKAFFVLANCYDDLNQLEKALIYYNKAISKNTLNPLYYMRRAILFGKMQQFQKCLKDLNQCTFLDNTYAEAYYWKGVVKVNLKQNPCADFKQALSLGYTAAQQPLLSYCR